jgi:hypothetical protein
MKTSTKITNPKDFIDPDKNVITLFDTDILVEVVNGRIDLNKVAMRVLKDRGLNKDGKWVGFECKSNKNNHIQ